MTMERPQNSRLIGGFQLWPWPWVCIVKLWVLHIISLNIFQRVQEIWSEHEIQGSNSWPLTVTLTLSRHACVMGSAHRLTKANIWPKFHEIFQRVQELWSEKERDGWPSIVTLTLSLHHWVIGSTHHLTKANIWPKFNKAVWLAMERPQNSRLKLVTFNCDLDLESA